jgi:hypothetical protein
MVEAPVHRLVPDNCDLAAWGKALVALRCVPVVPGYELVPQRFKHVPPRFKLELSWFKLDAKQIKPVPQSIKLVAFCFKHDANLIKLEPFCIKHVQLKFNEINNLSQNCLFLTILQAKPPASEVRKRARVSLMGWKFYLAAAAARLAARVALRVMAAC